MAFKLNNNIGFTEVFFVLPWQQYYPKLSQVTATERINVIDYWSATTVKAMVTLKQKNYDSSVQTAPSRG